MQTSNSRLKLYRVVLETGHFTFRFGESVLALASVLENTRRKDDLGIAAVALWDSEQNYDRMDAEERQEAIAQATKSYMEGA